MSARVARPADLDELAGALPAVERSTSYGDRPAFTVKGRTFVIYRGPRKDAVDEQVVSAARRSRHVLVGHSGGQNIQFHGGGAGAERQPHARRLRLDPVQVLVRVLRPGPGRQAVGQHAAGGVFDVEHSMQDAGLDGGRQPFGHHRLSTFTLSRAST